ncbi:MAG: hypothetical protein Q9161_001953 [Pseudevernia consocians]
MLTQTIEERYVDMKKLDKLLKDLFGQQKCEVEVKDEYIVLTVPKKLDKLIATDYRNVDLDSKLPLSPTDLSKVLETAVVAKEFYDTQWTFIPPEFTYSAIHRSLDANTILPFIGDPKELGEGGFGVVTEVILPQDLCQSIDEPSVQFGPVRSTSLQDLRTRCLVRKEFKPIVIGENQSTYEREESNLHILCRLKHPNIIPLISSYKFRGKINFLFPRASGGSLHDLLRNNDRPAELASDEDFLHCICGLCSAIETVHSFSISELNLSMIGCHHDIKPRNILVDGRNFILADFGLARLKMATESSKTDFVTGPAWYLSPECEDVEDPFEKHTISRPSDIWSLGCILLEVLTYLLKGPNGIAAFQQRRKIKFGIITTYIFHAGRQSKHPGVVSWMAELEDHIHQDKPYLLGVLAVIHEMLSIAPSDRPSASSVLYKMRHAYIALTYNALLEVFKRKLEAYDRYELQLEYERFSIWGCVLGLKPAVNVTPATAMILSPDLAFEPTTGKLVEMKRGLFQLALGGREPFYVARQALVDTNDALYNLLPSVLRQKCQVLLEQRMVAAADAEQLRLAEGSLQNTLPYRRLGMLAAIKRVTLLANSRKVQCRPDLQLEAGLVRCTESFGDHGLGLITSNFSFQGHERQVFIEFVRYDVHWEGSVTEEMMVRIEAIAEMHSQEDKPTDLRSLDCIGYFHQAQQHAFCIVYDFPLEPESDDENTKVYSLNKVLVLSQKWKERPFLGDRYRLAHSLAVSLLEFHTVDWLHKSLSAHNVIFFNNESKAGKNDLSRIRALEAPFIIGFSRSRPNEPAAYTNGPVVSSESRAYQHPQYAERKQSYLPEFDYYSLGLILLEIGLWMPLNNMMGNQNFSSFEEQRIYLLRARVPLLGHMVGKEYLAAVSVCLRTFGDSTDNKENDLVECSESKRILFSDEVVAKLRRLPF